ncbi:MAG: DUF4142 domain-containing protein [Chthoniobacteraceae bacterium]
MTPRLVLPLFLASLAVVAAHGAIASDPTDASARRPAFFSTDVSGGDLQFLKSAAEQGTLQATLGVLAADHASSSEVKDFGEALAKHHTTQNERIKLLALKKGVTITNGLNLQQNKIASSLSKLNGLKFDKAYMEEIINDQQTDITIFEEGALSHDPEIKAFATTALPGLRKNLDLVKKMAGIAPEGGAGVHFRVVAPAPSSSPGKS